MSQNAPPSQGFESNSGWPSVPDVRPGDVPVPDYRSSLESSSPTAVPAPSAGPAVVIGPRPLDIGDRILAIVEVLFACGILSSTAAYAFVAAVFETSREQLLKSPQVMFYFLLADTVFLLVVIHLFLRLHNQNFLDLGLRPRALAKNVSLGLLIAPGLVVLTGVASLIFKNYFHEYYQDSNPMLEVIRTPADLGFFLASGILAGGVREEIQRAFVLTRFHKYLFGVWPGLIIWSAFFGYMHYDTQGLQGAVITGLIGLCLGLLFHWRRNLYGPIAGHAAFNTIQLIWFWSAFRS